MFKPILPMYTYMFIHAHLHVYEHTANSEALSMYGVDADISLLCCFEWLMPPVTTLDISKRRC